MRYIFPRQYGLHNVFTSKVNPRETAMPLKDYTLREKEIHQSMCRDLGDKIHDANEVAKWKLRVPKRLRGELISLINKLRILNQRCSYTEMLRHYCPVEVSSSTESVETGADNCREYPYLLSLNGRGPASIQGLQLPSQQAVGRTRQKTTVPEQKVNSRLKKSASRTWPLP